MPLVEVEGRLAAPVESGTIILQDTISSNLGFRAIKFDAFLPDRLRMHGILDTHLHETQIDVVDLSRESPDYYHQFTPEIDTSDLHNDATIREMLAWQMTHAREAFFARKALMARYRPDLLSR